MNRSQRSKRNLSSKSVTNEWKSGEEVLKMSPSPMKRKSSRRDTKIGLKKASEKLSPPKPDRRKSMILKRLETDFVDTADSVILPRKRTRQQSMATISKTENKMVKTQIPRAKSEKTIIKKKVSTTFLLSPAVRIEKLRITNAEPNSRRSETIKKSLLKTEEALSISKVSFYSKSPPKVRQTRRQSMAKMSKIKTSPAKLRSPKSSRTEFKLRIKSEIKSETLPSNEKSHPLKRKVIEKREESQDKLEKKLSQRKKATEKAKTPLKKPIKRLSNVTPSPMIVNNKRLTRSSKKRVKIYAESPSGNNDYRKTPKSANKILHRETPLSSNISASILKPYTPKPEEPLKILKQTLKRNVAIEIRNCLQTDSSDFTRPSIASVRKPLKSSPSPPKTPVKNGIHHHEDFNSGSFQIPSTPLSSRKSVSFRRFRGSVRLMESESIKKNDACESVLSLKSPLNSTPVRSRKNSENYHFSNGHDTSMDFSDVSSTLEESKCSVSSSFTTHDRSYNSRIEESNVDEKVDSTDKQSNKRSYCSLM